MPDQGLVVLLIEILARKVKYTLHEEENVQKLLLGNSWVRKKDQDFHRSQKRHLYY